MAVYTYIGNIYICVFIAIFCEREKKRTNPTSITDTS